MDRLSHVDSAGRAVMVDVTGKEQVHRIARARGNIQLTTETIRLIRENEIKKGDVLTVAEIAGVNAAKQTPALVPLCHPLQLGRINLQTQLETNAVTVTAEVACVGRTGVEMEALTAVAVALLTVYDMCKAVDKTMVIGNIELIEKTKTPLSRTTTDE